MNNDEQAINNLLTFLDRVSVTGRKEMQAYAEGINWLESKRPKKEVVDFKKPGLNQGTENSVKAEVVK